MNPLVVWVTGLSGAGKTTVGRSVADQLHTEGSQVIFLDGDELRSVFFTNAYQPTNLDRQGRLELAFRYARLCQLLAKQNFIVVIATISMFREVHAWNREHLPGYFEVYLKVPIEELRRRDPKGIYSRFDKGELKDVAGIDLPIDEPESPDLLIEFDSRNPPSVLADTVISRLRAKDKI